jgi:hypothetical protein
VIHSTFLVYLCSHWLMMTRRPADPCALLSSSLIHAWLDVFDLRWRYEWQQNVADRLREGRNLSVHVRKEEEEEDLRLRNIDYNFRVA